jgi:hypothetical protein
MVQIWKGKNMVTLIITLNLERVKVFQTKYNNDNVSYLNPCRFKKKKMYSNPSMSLPNTQVRYLGQKSEAVENLTAGAIQIKGNKTVRMTLRRQVSSLFP